MTDLKKMKIGTDIDEVVAEFVKGYLRFYNSLKGTNFKYEDVFCYDLWKVLGISKEEAFKIADDFYASSEFNELELIKGASEGIRALPREGNLAVITSRPLWIRDKTERFLEKHFSDVQMDLYFSGDIFIGQGKTKKELCKDLELDVFIDDSARFADECGGNGTRALLFDRKWNGGQEVSNAERTYGWDHVLWKLGVEK